MLVVSRKPDQSIVLPGLGIRIKVVKIKRNEVRLGITADKEVLILREEVLDRSVGLSDIPHGIGKDEAA